MSKYKRIADVFRSDAKFLDSNVPFSNQEKQNEIVDSLLKSRNGRKLRVLELGSREVTGKSTARDHFRDAEYVGFDIYAGPNVDVVGDAHHLASYFAGQKFDLIYSVAVFEHLAMPWVVTPQIAELLNIGGLVQIATHFSYSSHERPWHFFQFSDMALRALFPPSLGIECLDAGASNPIVGYFSSLAEPRLTGQRVRGLYCGSEFLGRKVRDVTGFDWSSADTDEIVGNTAYPSPSNGSV